MANNGWKNSSWCRLRIVIIDFIHGNGKTNDKRSDMKRGHGFKSLVPALSVIVMVEKRSKSTFSAWNVYIYAQLRTFATDIKPLICFMVWESTKRNLSCAKQ